MTTNSNELFNRLQSGEKIPAHALRCLMPELVATPEAANAEAKSLKVHLKARTRDAINHWYFGTVYHDFSTAKLPEKVALDDSHGNEVGYARPSLTDYGLELNGVVIRNTEDPQHESNRIAYNLANAIPQQASIDFTGDYKLAFVEPGATFDVNGLTKTATADGAVIVKDWSLRSCAVCKEGADPTTETTTFTQGGEVGPSPLSITKLSAEAAPPVAVEAKPTELVEAPAVETKPVATEPTPTRDVLAELTHAEAIIIDLQAQVGVLNQRLAAASTAGAPPIPVTDVPGPQTWSEALAAVNAEHPHMADWQQHAEACKRFPELRAKINSKK
jgi:hypothetical protein